MKRTLLLLLPALLFSAVAVRAALAEPSGLPRRATVPLLASDGIMTAATPPVPLARPTRQPPPDGPGYCGASNTGIPSPPNAMFGHFTIGGSLAPYDTLVTMAFDGHPGPSIYTAEDGGYRFFYAAGGNGHDPPCINIVDSEIGLIVNGVLYNTGVHVGPEAGLAFLYDLDIP